MSCGLGRHFIINSPSFSLSIVPSLPPFLHPLWFNLSGGKGRVSMEMNMNAVIMCDWECTADGCQDNMGASHPSRLVDEQEKSAEPQWCMGCTVGAGRDEPLLSAPTFASAALLQPCTILRTSAREAVLFLWMLWSLLVSTDHFHTFSFFFSKHLTTENNQGLVSHIHLYLHVQYFSPLLPLFTGVIHEISVCASVFILHVFMSALKFVICHWKHTFQTNLYTIIL